MERAPTLLSSALCSVGGGYLGNGSSSVSKCFLPGGGGGRISDPIGNLILLTVPGWMLISTFFAWMRTMSEILTHISWFNMSLMGVVTIS